VSQGAPSCIQPNRIEIAAEDVAVFIFRRAVAAHAGFGEYKIYRVRPNENLSTIAVRFYGKGRGGDWKKVQQPMRTL
jgi:hypothetical protein